MKLEHKMPQLIPMNGRRVKIYHKGIDKLCTGTHRKSDCKEEKKVEWIDYVANSMALNREFPEEFYGRWKELVEKHQGDSSGRPKNKNIPREQTNH